MMRNKKSLLFSVVLVCVCVLSALVFASCNKKSGGLKVTDTGDTYEWEYVKQFTGEKDADMQIDGVLDEARWQNKKWLHHADQGVQLRYTTAFTEKGLYIAAEAKDPKMQWNQTRSFMNNSSFKFYLVSNTADQFHCFTNMGFYVDEKNSACRQQTRFTAVARKTTDGTPTLTAEFFSTWEDLNYTVNAETGMPEFVRLVPMYRFVEGFESAANAYLKPAFTEVENDRIDNALIFGKDGYVNADAADAPLGNAANGFAKSDGWDLSRMGENVISTTAGNGQAIFFKNIYSARYSYAVNMEIKGGWQDAYPSAGVCDMKSASAFNCLRLSGNDILANTGRKLTYNLLDFYVSLWHDVSYGSRDLADGASRVVNVRVIKDNDRYYYIFNGVYAFSVQLEWLDGKTCPGLYSLGANVTYSDWEVTDYEGADKDAAFNALLDTYMTAVRLPVQIPGGMLSLDRFAAPKGQAATFNLTVTPSRGYILTDLTVDDTSVFNDVVNRMDKGVYALTVNSTVAVNATFSELPDNCVRVIGYAERSSGTSLINTSYEYASTGDAKKLLYTHSATSASGAFDIMLLRQGTYTIGGQQITTNGVYELTFDGVYAGAADEAKATITIDTNEEKFAGKTFYELEDPVVIDPLHVQQMKENGDKTVQTTNTAFDEMYSYYVYNTSLTGSFLVETEIDASNDKWPCYGITVEDEGSNSMQFLIGGATTYRFMVDYNGAYAQKDPGATFIEKNGVQKYARIALVYDQFTDTFYFHCNGVLFDTVRREKLLSGDSFRFGVVGYMSGNDGSETTVTEDKPLAKFQPFTVAQKYNVMVEVDPSAQGVAANDVEITVDGKKVTDGKIPVIATAKIRLAETNAAWYAFRTSGINETIDKSIALQTRHEDGYAVATLTLTQDTKIWVRKVQKVAGTVEVADEYRQLGGINLATVDVTVVGTNGGVVFTGKANANGDFEVGLADDTFYITAMGKNLVSGVYKTEVQNGVVVKVNDVAHTGALKITLDKPGIDEWMFKGMTFGTQTGHYVSEQDNTSNGGYLAGALIENEKQYLMQATFREMGEKDWPSAGVMAGKISRYALFQLVRNTDATPNAYMLRVLASTGEQYIMELPETWRTGLMDDKTKPVTFTLVHNGGNYFIILQQNGRDTAVLTLPATQTLKYEQGGRVVRSKTLQEAIGNTGRVRFGLFAERSVTFLDWKYSFDVNEIATFIGKELTVPNGVTVTVNGQAATVTGGKAKVNLGDVVTLTKSAAAGELWYFSVGGKRVMTENKNNQATATFTVTDSAAVTFSAAYVVSGSVTGGNAQTSFTVVDNNNEEVYTGKTDGSGAFTTALSNGTYYVTAQSATRVSDAATVTVNGAAVSGISLNLHKIAVSGKIGSIDLLAFDGRTGGYYSEKGTSQSGGWMAGVTANGAFTVSVRLTDMGKTDAWPSGGFVVGNDDAFVKFEIVCNVSDPNNIGYIGRVITDEGLQWTGYVPDSLKAGISDQLYGNNATGLTIALSYANGSYYFYFGNELAFVFQDTLALNWNNEKFTTIGDILRGISEKKIGLYGEQQVRFGEWTFANEAISGLQTVSGSVTGGDANTEVQILRDSGTVAYRGKGSTYAVALPAGNYTVSATSETSVSTVQAFTVASSAVTVPAIAMRPKLLFSEAMVINGVNWEGFAYQSQTGAYASVNDRYSNGFFAEANADADFTLSMQVKNTSGKTWAYIGFVLMGQDGKFVRFSLGESGDAFVIKNKDNKQQVAWFASKEGGRNIPNPFGDDKSQTVRYTMVHAGGAYSLYLGDTLAFGIAENTRLGDGDTVQNSIGSGRIRLGLYAEQAMTVYDWNYSADVSEYMGMITGSATGVSGAATVAVKNGYGDVVYTATSTSFTARLPKGNYIVSAEGDTVVAQDVPVTVTAGGTATATIVLRTKVEHAAYTINGGSWTADTEAFAFQADSGRYHGNYGKFTAGMLKTPASVSAADEYVVCADVEILADWQYPSVGIALYNGSNVGQNVKFEVVRATASETDKDGHERLVRVNGKNYIRGEGDNSSSFHSDWVRDNQEALKGKVTMALVHTASGYYLFLNGTQIASVTGDNATNLTNGWGSIRLGFYAEQEAVFSAWSYSTDVSGYIVV